MRGLILCNDRDRLRRKRKKRKKGHVIITRLQDAN